MSRPHAIAMDETDPGSVTLAAALNEVLDGIVEASRYHGVPLAILGASVVQSVLALMRHDAPGDEWRKQALAACANAIDAADQKTRQTHEVPHVTQ